VPDPEQQERMLSILRLATGMVEGANGNLAEVRQSIIAGLSAMEKPQSAEGDDPRPLWEIINDHLATIERRQNGERWAISSGLPWIDRMTGGWHRGEFIVVGGASSAGKSVLGLQFARTAAMRGYRVLYVLLEMTTEQMIDRVLSSVAGVNFRRLADGKLDSREWKSIFDAAMQIHEQKVHIVIDDRCPATLAAIEERARRAATNGLDMVVVDYVGEIAEEPGRQTRVEHVGRIATGLRTLAKQLKIPVIALAQLNREAGTGKPSFQSHLGESKRLGDTADVALLIWRPNRLVDGTQPAEEVIEIGVDKQRNGPVGWAEFTLVGAQMTVRERASTAQWTGVA
jgi:replicative DNA helicase